ncbi:hypothetical protein BOX15_Mlig007309g2, partial [Macrostomum lignano]
IFLLVNMHELGLLTGDPLQQYLRLVRKKGSPPANQISASQKDSLAKNIGEILN